jgi:hypothetical protein
VTDKTLLAVSLSLCLSLPCLALQAVSVCLSFAILALLVLRRLNAAPTFLWLAGRCGSSRVSLEDASLSGFASEDT